MSVAIDVDTYEAICGKRSNFKFFTEEFHLVCENSLDVTQDESVIDA
jgi:hypothetical protein